MSRLHHFNRIWAIRSQLGRMVLVHSHFNDSFALFDVKLPWRLAIFGIYVEIHRRSGLRRAPAMNGVTRRQGRHTYSLLFFWLMVCLRGGEVDVLWWNWLASVNILVCPRLPEFSRRRNVIRILLVDTPLSQIVAVISAFSSILACALPGVVVGDHSKSIAFIGFVALFACPTLAEWTVLALFLL